jgi:hypothetical protein
VLFEFNTARGRAVVAEHGFARKARSSRMQHFKDPKSPGVFGSPSRVLNSWLNLTPRFICRQTLS